MKLSLGQAAKQAGVAKATLQRMLKDGRASGVQRPDGVYEIDLAEVERIAKDKDRPRSGKRLHTGVAELRHIDTDLWARLVEAERNRAVAAEKRCEDLIRLLDQAIQGD